MAQKMRLFISHITEEKASAVRLKQVLMRDFRDLFVFVSSDTESIAAGDDWLDTVEKALRDCAVFVILCSQASVRRPWINFEAGAAWIRNIPIVPICHLGLGTDSLPLPLSLRQGIAMNNPEDLRKLYKRIADALSIEIPSKNFSKLSEKLTVVSESLPLQPTPDARETRRETEDDVRKRIRLSLQSQPFKWRSLERVASTAAMSEGRVADLLRSDPDVRFSKSKTGNIIVGLRSRVGV